jgi:hypothetical protein
MLSRMIALAAALVMVIPGLGAQDQEAEKDKLKDKGQAEKKENPARLPTISGTLQNSGGDKGNLVVQVTETYPQRSGKQVSWKQRHKTIELRAAEDMIVRTAAPPLVRDDKGKPIQHTAKELKELKGEGNLPGYQAELSSLKKGQSVMCYYVLPKPTKKADTEAHADTKPRVRMIVIGKGP